MAKVTSKRTVNARNGAARSGQIAARVESGASRSAQSGRFVSLTPTQRGKLESLHQKLDQKSRELPSGI